MGARGLNAPGRTVMTAPEETSQRTLAGHGEAVDDEAEDGRAQQRAEEGAHDPAPEAVGHEDREVPDGEAHHDPGEHGHG